MCRTKIIVTAFLFCFFTFCFGQTNEDPFYSKKETLYSTKSGLPIGELLLSIEPKTTNPNNSEWILTIGDKGEKFFDTPNEKTLWIFNQKKNVNQFVKDLKNRDYLLEVKGIKELMPFSENGVPFDMRDWDELRKQTQVTFTAKGPPGEKVTLRLVFYTASSDKKKTTITDEAKLRIVFEIPKITAGGVVQPQGQGSNVVTLDRQTPGGAAGGGAGGAQPDADEEIDPSILEAHRQDSIQRAEAANREQRIVLLDAFITERNREIGLLQNEVNKYIDDKENRVNESTIDSLVTVADEMKNKVDYWENGYSDILLADEAIHDKFSKFRITHTLTLKKLDELKQLQKPYNFILEFIKSNLLLSLGIVVGGAVFLKFFLKLLKKLQSMIKSKINQKVSKMKADAAKRAKGQADKWKDKRKREEALEEIDIKDLDRI